MTTENVELPSSLGVMNCIGFCNELFGLPHVDSYVFDFGNIRWFPPFSMLYLSNQINRFRAERIGSRWIAQNYEQHTYAAHMGFFKSFNLQHGNEVGEADGSTSYVPLTRIFKKELQDQAATGSIQIGDVIQQQSNRLAFTLTRETSSNLYVTLSYSIREILRNSVEHSGTDEVLFCAQYWPTRGEVEVGICDAGKGIYEGLRTNPHLRMEDDYDALILSLLPGVSGIAYEGVPRNPYDAWANSGYGLYMTSNICGNSGSFLIASGETALIKNNSNTQAFSQSFQGTAIRLLMKIDRIGKLDKELRILAQKGREIAEEINGVDAFGPSIISHLTSRDNDF